MRFINFSRNSYNWGCAPILIAVILGASCAGIAFASGDESGTTTPVQTIFEFFSRVGDLFISFFTAVNNWMKAVIGFNFTDFLNILVKIISWMINMLIKGFYWLIGYVS